MLRRACCWLVLSLAVFACREAAAQKVDFSKAGKTETTIFGVTGAGSKFIYVFDRSLSMGDYKGAPLAAAKKELLKSIDELDTVHQFQIVFYNENTSVVNLRRGAAPRLLFGSDNDKAAAVEFVRGIKPDGGSGHLGALKLALGMKPDVIFFLTDAGDPGMSRQELAEVKRKNESIGCVIHTIEFGVGKETGESFLTRLAEQNNGKRVFVDASKLGSQ